MTGRCWWWWWWVGCAALQVRMMDKLALEKERFDALLEKFQLDVKRAKVHSDYDAYEAITEEVGLTLDRREGRGLGAEQRAVVVVVLCGVCLSGLAVVVSCCVAA